MILSAKELKMPNPRRSEQMKRLAEYVVGMAIEGVLTQTFTTYESGLGASTTLLVSDEFRLFRNQVATQAKAQGTEFCVRRASAQPLSSLRRLKLPGLFVSSQGDNCLQSFVVVPCCGSGDYKDDSTHDVVPAGAHLLVLDHKTGKMHWSSKYPAGENAIPEIES